MTGANIDVDVGIALVANINGSNDTVNGGNSGSIININAGTNDDINASGWTINVAAGAQANVGGTDTVNLTGSTVAGGGGSVNISGGSDTITGGSNCSVGIGAGTGDTVNESNASLWLNTSTAATLTGTGNTVTTSGTDTLTIDDAGNSVYAAGDGNTVNATGNQTITVVGNNSSFTTGGTVNVNAGTGDTVTMSNGTLWLNGGTGSGTVGSGVAGVGVVGSGNQITTNGGNTLLLNDSGGGNTVTANGDKVTLYATGKETLSVNGSNDALAVGSGSWVGLGGGTDDLVNETKGTLWLNSGTGGGLVGTGNQVNTSGKNALTCFDSGNTISAVGDGVVLGTANGASETVSVAGSNDAFALGDKSWVGIGSGTGDNVAMSNGSMWMNTGTTATVCGDSDQLLTAGGGTTAITLAGAGDSLYADNATSVLVEGNGAYGAADSVTDASGTVTLNSDPAANINGARADIFGSNVTVNVDGPNENVGIHDSGVTYNDSPSNGSTDGVWLGGNLTGLTLNGSGETINANLSGDQAAVDGSNVLVDSTVSGNSFIVNGQQETIDASSDTINCSKGSFATVNGTNDAVSAYDGDAVALSSPSDTLTVDGFVQALINNATVSSTDDTGSLLDFYNDPTYSQTSQIDWGYTQPTLTGDLTSLDANWTSGGSQDINYSYDGSDLETGFTVTDVSTSGTDLGSGSYSSSGDLLSSTGSYSGYTSFSDAGSAFGDFQVAGHGKPVDVSAIVNYDNRHGHGDAAQAAERAAAWVNKLAEDESAMSDTAKRHAVFEGGRWGSTVITWSIAHGPGTGDSPFSGPLASQYETIVAQAFAAWGKASGLTFHEVADSPQADIRIGWSKFDSANSGVLGYTSGGKQNGAFQQGVTIQLEDPAEDQLAAGANGKLTYAGSNADFYQLVMHEIGHALGLADNADPNSVMYYAGGGSILDGSDLTGITALYGAMPGNVGPSITMPSATGTGTDATLQQFVQAIAGMNAHTAPVLPANVTPFDFTSGDPTRPAYLAAPHMQAA